MKTRHLACLMCFLSLCVTSLSLGNSEPLRLNALYDSDMKFLTQLPSLAWGADPFEKTPGYGSKVEADKLPRLEAVFYNSKQPSAMLDGEEYIVGESIGSNRIYEIGKNYVLLEKGSSLVELSIPPGEDTPPKIDIREHVGRTR